MSDELRPNFGLCENETRRCFTCKMIQVTASEATYCMAGIDQNADPESGQRVNQNFVCDNFAAK